MSHIVALSTGREADELQARHPNAFLLLCYIARRRKVEGCPVSNLKPGEAEVVWRDTGIPSEQSFRTAKALLSSIGYVEFIGERRRTVALLKENPVFLSVTDGNGQTTDRTTEDSVAYGVNNIKSNGHPTDSQRTANGQPTDTSDWIGSGFGSRKPTSNGQDHEIESNTSKTVPENNPSLPVNNGQTTDTNPKGLTTCDDDLSVTNGLDTLGGGRGGSVPLHSTEKITNTRRTHSSQGVSVEDSTYAKQALQIVEAYAKGHRKFEAVELVKGHLRAGDDFQKMLEGTKACAAVIRRHPNGANGRYVPGAFTFFERKQWMDDPQAVVAPPENNHREQRKADEIASEKPKIRRLGSTE